MDDEELIEEIVNYLGGADSPSNKIPTRNNILDILEEVFNMYWEANNSLEEIKDLCNYL